MTVDVNELVSQQRNVSSIVQAVTTTTSRKRRYSQLTPSAMTAVSSTAMREFRADGDTLDGNVDGDGDVMAPTSVLRWDESIPPLLDSISSANHNHNNNRNHPQLESRSIATGARLEQLTLPLTAEMLRALRVEQMVPALPNTKETQTPLKTEGWEHGDIRYSALLKLSAGLSVVEDEKLAKRKWDVYEMSKQRLKALESHTRDILRESPELIGSVLMGSAPVRDQRTMLFDAWLKDNRALINRLVMDPQEFVNVYLRLQSRPDEWDDFTSSSRRTSSGSPLPLERRESSSRERFPTLSSS